MEQYTSQAIERKKNLEIRNVLLGKMDNNNDELGDTGDDMECGNAAKVDEMMLQARENESLISANSALDKTLATAQNAMDSLLRQKVNVKGMPKTYYCGLPRTFQASADTK